MFYGKENYSYSNYFRCRDLIVFSEGNLSELRDFSEPFLEREPQCMKLYYNFIDYMHCRFGCYKWNKTLQILEKDITTNFCTVQRFYLICRQQRLPYMTSTIASLATIDFLFC